MTLSLGAPLQREHKDRLNNYLPGRFYELCELTEGFITVLDKTDCHAKLDSVDFPQPFSEKTIVEEEGKQVPARGVG